MTTVKVMSAAPVPYVTDPTNGWIQVQTETNSFKSNPYGGSRAVKEVRSALITGSIEALTERIEQAAKRGGTLPGKIVITEIRESIFAEEQPELYATLVESGGIEARRKRVDSTPNSPILSVGDDPILRFSSFVSSESMSKEEFSNITDTLIQHTNREEARTYSRSRVTTEESVDNE